jgi:hypothetical protein
MVFVLPLVVSACGGGTRPAEEPESAETIVVIPEVTEEQSKKAEKEPSAPSSKRDPLAALDIGTTDVDTDMWGGSAAGGPRGGPDCSRAASLCLAFYGKQPTQNPDMLRICNNLRSAPSSMCTMIYTQFQQVMPGSGTTP